jgi:hypothetical protein
MDGVYGNGDDQTWSLTTDTDGHYYFDATIVNDNRRPSSWLGVSAINSGILPGFEYKIEIDPSQTALIGYSITGKNSTLNSTIDSDGSLSGSKIVYVVNAGGSTAAASQFSNDYNIDFGFVGVVLPLKQLKLSAVLGDDNVKVGWNTIEEFGVRKYHAERSIDGKNFVEINSVNSKANGNFSYELNDGIKSLNASTIYYRLRIEDFDGKYRYSVVVTVNPGKPGTMLQVSPNPFTDNLNLQINNTQKTDVRIRIVNAAGQSLYNKTISMEKGVNSIVLNDFQNYARGMYIIEVKTADQYISHKLLKQ